MKNVLSLGDWSSKAPTVQGYYWWRGNESDKPEVVYFRGDCTRYVGKRYNGAITGQWHPRRLEAPIVRGTE